MYAVLMFLYTVWDGHGGFTSAQDFFVSDSQSKKKSNFKNPMSPDPFVSHAKAPPTKRSEKNYEDENEVNKASSVSLSG